MRICRAIVALLSPMSLMLPMRLMLLALFGVMMQGTCSSANPPRSVLVEGCVVRFGREIEVPALHSAMIAELKVKLNDMVDADQVLARQDDTYLLLQRRSAAWQQQAAQEEAADKVDLEYSQALYAETLAQRDADRTVYEKGGASLRTLRQNDLAVHRAQLEIRRAEKQLRLALMNTEMRAAEVAAVDEQLRRMTIKSPITGVVLQINKHVGEWIQEGEPIATVARIDHLQVDAFLHASQLPAHQASGCSVVVSWTSNQKSQQLTGVIQSVDRQILTGGRYRLHATIENQRDGKSWRLWPGTSVTMHVQLPSDAEQLSVLPGSRSR